MITTNIQPTNILNITSNEYNFTCHCGNVYKYKSGFYKHIKKCLDWRQYKEHNDFILQNPELEPDNDEEELLHIDISQDNDSLEYKPNIFLICVESLSGDFLEAFGN